MRPFALIASLAGCGRLGFGAGGLDGAIDGVSDTASGDVAQEITCSPAFDICDGFEDGVNVALWTLDDGATLDTTFAHRGTNSIRIHTAAFGANQSSYTSISESQTLANDPTAFWVRGWFYLSALPAGDNGMELITAERPGNQGDYLFIRQTRTTVYSQYSGDVEDSMTPAPVGTWFCAVFGVVRGTASNGSLRLSGDLPALTLANTTTDSATLPMQIVTLGAGFAGSNVPVAQPELDLWIDDVIIHRAPVSCSD